MTLIHVPRPPQSAANPDRAVSSLLRTQICHLHEAEKNLPLRYRSEKYIQAIKTEGEAAAYIRDITEGILQAHADAAVERAKRTRRRKRGLEIAAAAESSQKRGSRSRAKKTTGKTDRDNTDRENKGPDSTDQKK